MLGETLFECKLYNASNGIGCDFSGGHQNVTVKTMAYHNTVAANTSVALDGRDGYSTTSPEVLSYSTIVAYQSICEAFGSHFEGSLYGHLDTYKRTQTLVQPNLDCAEFQQEHG